MKSLVAAKAASIGLQAASVALNAAISTGITLAISALLSQISKWIHSQEEARQKAIDLTNSYKEQRDSLNSQIEKYKELKETLDNGNLSTDETRSIKEQLLEIQKSLIELYGDEASNINLVNGKYRDQLGLLNELSKEKATDYVTENRDVFADAKEALEKIRTYDLGTVTSWSAYAPKTDEQKKLIEYLENYSELLDLDYLSTPGYDGAVVNLLVKANVENADELMHQLAEDLEQYGKDNNINVSGLLEGISRQLRETWTDELKESKTIYDEFMTAEVIRNDTLRPLYQQSIQAVEDYNEALSSGEGVAEAKAHLDSVQQSVQNATSKLEGSQEVFDSIYDGINKSAESAYNLSQSFENDESVKRYAEQLKGLTNIDLQAINFEDNVQSPGEEAFGALIDILGLSEDEVQNLIDKLVELGYVQGDVQSSTSNIENPISIVPTISSSIQQLATQLEPQFAKLGEAYQAIFTDNGFTLDNVDNPMLEGLIQSFAEIEEEVGVAFDATKLDPFFDAITDKSGSAEEQARRVQDAFNELATAYFYSTETLEQLNAETADAIEKQLEEMGVQNAAEVVADALTAKTEELIVAKEYLAQTGKELASATEEEQTAFILEQIEAGNCGEALALLQLKKMLVNGTLLDATSDINNVLALTQAAGITSDALTRLAALKSAFDIAQASGNYGAMNAISAEMEKVKNQVETDIENFKPVEFGSTSATESAAKAGKEAGGAYVDAFGGELEELEQLRDSGVITEKEYLDRLRVLYEKYFENKLGYEKEYAKYQRQYLEGYKSLYESALSGISTLLDNQIDGYTDARDAAVSSLTDEKEARLEVIDAQKEQLEAQKDLIDEQIEAKQKLIDDIQDEIDAMKEANAERQRQLDLQKAQYELERMQHQRTILQYSESDGMQYVQDNEGLRTAKENVDNAKLEIEISNKEKNISLLEDEISLLEEQKDAIQNQMDLLDKQAEQVESYYSKMISETEAYYDSLISNMERQKSKWEEIAEIESIARAYSDLEQVAGGMGYSVQDILSGNEQAFEDFKSRYIALLSDLNNNSSFSEGLSYATSGIAQDIDNLEASAATVSESTDDIAANIGEINANAETLSSSLSDINNALSGFSKTENITAAADAFSRLGKAVQSVADALNISEDGTIGSLTDALKSLCEMPLCETDDDGKSGGILSKFQALKTAVTDVTSAISGGGSSTSADGDASDSSSLSMSSGASGGSSGGLVGAIDSLKSAANDALGGSGSDDSKEQSEGSGIIAQFGQLKNAVTDTAAAIGSGDSKQKEKSKGNSKNGNLISSITSLGSTTAEILTGDGKNEDKSGGVVGRFEQLKDVIGEANEHVTGIATGLSDINGQTVECTIKVNIEQNGELPSYAQSALGHTKLESSEYHAKLGRTFAKGTGNYKGLPHAEKNALRSEYGQPELTVYPNGTTELTTQPTISDLPKGTIVFNETQTQKIFQNKPDPIGNTYTDGYAGQNTSGKLILTPAQRPSSLVAQELQEECLTKTGSIVDKIISPVTMMSCNMKEMTGLLRNINHINHNGQNQSVNVGDINITCPGITSQEVARQVGAELNHIFSGFHNYADQQSRIR